MPLRCVGFSDYLGTIGAILIMGIMVGILSFVTMPFGAAGKLLINALRISLSLYGSYMFLNMLATVTGIRGKCEQGFRSGWPPIRGTLYHKDPVTGLKIEDPMPKMF